MSTIATPSQPLAYRCTKCFQTRCSSVDCVGQTVSCELCGNENTVPEATPDRIAQGESYLEKSESGAVSQIKLNDPAEIMTRSEIMKQCRQETIAKTGVSALAVSIPLRFIGRMIDSAAMVFALVAGAFIAYSVAPPVNGEPATPLYLAILFFIPLTLQIVQFGMIAMDGRTIGKYCVNAKIVDENGNPPGFLKGVLMRSWVNCLLGLIPFYGLVDSFWIFSNNSNRCLHDILAGTHVIHAS